jgi:hypothetical protein
MEALLDALRDSMVAGAFRRSFYVYPVVNALHILGIGLLVGAILPFDLRVLGALRAVPLAAAARLQIRFAAFGLVLAVSAGFMLFTAKPHEYVANPAFVTKIGLVALGTANALAVRIGLQWKSALATDIAGPRIRLHSAASLLIWLSAVFAGRFIAFVGD